LFAFLFWAIRKNQAHKKNSRYGCHQIVKTSEWAPVLFGIADAAPNKEDVFAVFNYILVALEDKGREFFSRIHQRIPRYAQIIV